MELTEENFDTFELREKAICELVNSTRMTINEIINLTFGDFVKSIEHHIIENSICPYDIYEICDLLYLSDNLVGIWEINSEDFISSHKSIIAILKYLENERDQCIPFDEPLFQCDYGGELSRYHILNIFEEVNSYLSNFEGYIE